MSWFSRPQRDPEFKNLAWIAQHLVGVRVEYSGELPCSTDPHKVGLEILRLISEVEKLREEATHG